MTALAREVLVIIALSENARWRIRDDAHLAREFRNPNRDAEEIVEFRDICFKCIRICAIVVDGHYIDLFRSIYETAELVIVMGMHDLHHNFSARHNYRTTRRSS